MSEKTEKPTSKKLRDARKKGDVPHSQDVAKAFLIWAFLGYLVFYGKQSVIELSDLLQWVGDHVNDPFDVVLAGFLDLASARLVSLSLPFLIIVIAFSIFADLVHMGPVFAPDKITPTLDKVSVINNVKNTFSMRNLLEALKSMLKVIVLSWALYVVLRDNLGSLLLLPEGGVLAVGDALATLVKALLVISGIVFVVVAAADVFLQRRLFLKQQKMSKDDVKRERKDNDGDPEIKGKRKELHREMMNDATRVAARGATAVVVNPVHFAVALLYDAERTPLPLVVAKGEGTYARMIVREARGAGVPVVQDIALARALMADAELDDYVPSHLLEGVVEILRAVRDMGSIWH